MKHVLFFALSILTGMFFVFQSVNAQTVEEQYQDMQSQGIIFAGICDNAYDECACRDQGKCELADMLQLLVNLSVFILAISGSAIMLIIVYGGMKWILAHGDTKMVTEGKDAIVGAVIGLAIILGAYVAINVVVSVLKTGEIPTTELEDTVGGSSGDIIETQ
jgi:hypothetical protein